MTCQLLCWVRENQRHKQWSVSLLNLPTEALLRYFIPSFRRDHTCLHVHTHIFVFYVCKKRMFYGCTLVVTCHWRRVKTLNRSWAAIVVAAGFLCWLPLTFFCVACNENRRLFEENLWLSIEMSLLDNKKTTKKTSLQFSTGNWKMMEHWLLHYSRYFERRC